MITELKEIKQLYRRYMNGIVSQSMREKGMPYRVNFGLTLPMLRNIAQGCIASRELACELWQDRGVRESLLLAPMLCPAEEFSAADATRWAHEMPTAEVADFCCKFLFARLADAPALALQWVQEDGELTRYTGVRLACSLWDSNVDDDFVRQMAAHALPLCCGEGQIAAIARRWVSDSPAHPAGAAIVASCIAAAQLPAEWAQRLADLLAEA